MSALQILYTFLALMGVNLLASFIYLFGTKNLVAAVKRSGRKRPPH